MLKFLSVSLSLLALFSRVWTSDVIRLLPDDPYGIVGETLRMWCITSAEYSDVGISVNFRNNRSRQMELTAVNETTVEIIFHNLTPAFNDARISCSAKDRRDASVVTSKQILNVGYRPFLPIIQPDYKVHNWNSFSFSWTINDTNPIYQSKYEAWYRTSSQAEFTSCNLCEGIERQRCPKQGGNTCQIPKALDLVHPNGMLFFKVNGSNAVGQVSTDVKRANLFHIIQPGIVKNVTVISSVSTGTAVEFYSPRPNSSLKYRLNVTCGNVTFPLIQSRNLSHSNPIRLKVDLPVPPFTQCVVHVSCLPFHNRQYWSEWSEGVPFLSPDGVPLTGPQVCCFESHEKKQDIRFITVFFKHLLPHEARGEVQRYLIVSISNGSDTVLPYKETKYADRDKDSYQLEVYKKSDYDVLILAETRAGVNLSASSHLYIPSQENILSYPQNTTAVWYGSGIVRVSWLPLDGSFNYLVVWCKESSHQCSESLHWTPSGQNSFHDIRLGPDDSHLQSRFGIVVTSSNGKRSSSINWIDCTYNISAGANAPDVRVIAKSGRSVTLYLEKPPCKAGYIYKYHFSYVKIGQESHGVTVILDPQQLNDTRWTVANDGLHPGSTYNFSIVALTFSGPSDATVILEATNPEFEWTPPILAGVIIAATIALLLICIGIYKCFRWHKSLCQQIRKWFNLDITVPKKQTLARGTADGVNSGSYNSLLPSKEVQLQLSGNNSNVTGVVDDKNGQDDLSTDIDFSEQQRGVEHCSETEKRSSGGRGSSTRVKRLSNPMCSEKEEVDKAGISLLTEVIIESKSGLRRNPSLPSAGTNQTVSCLNSAPSSSHVPSSQKTGKSTNFIVSIEPQVCDNEQHAQEQLSVDEATNTTRCQQNPSPGALLSACCSSTACPSAAQGRFHGSGSDAAETGSGRFSSPANLSSNYESASEVGSYSHVRVADSISSLCDVIESSEETVSQGEEYSLASPFDDAPAAAAEDGVEEEDQNATDDYSMALLSAGPSVLLLDTVAVAPSVDLSLSAIDDDSDQHNEDDGGDDDSYSRASMI